MAALVVLACAAAALGGLAQVGDVNCDGRRGAADAGAAILVSAQPGRLPACAVANEFRGLPVTAAPLAAVVEGIFGGPALPPPTPTPRVRILDIGPLFGVPQSQTQTAFELTQPFELGSIRLELYYDPAFAPAEPACEVLQLPIFLEVDTGRPGVVVADLTLDPGSPTAFLSAGPFLRCNFQVLGTTGSYPLNVLGVFTPAGGEPETVQLTRFFTIQCIGEESCPEGQLCDQGSCRAVPGSSNPGELTTAGDALYFAADDGVHGRELWVTDGTTGGTRLVADLDPEFSSAPREMVDYRGAAAFVVSQGLTGEAVYHSDGTAAGTQPLASFDVGEGFERNRPCCLTPSAGDLFFVVRDLVDNSETLWRTSSAPGTAAPVRAFDRIDERAALHDRLYFSGGDFAAPKLWQSDGTAGGTHPIDTPDGRVESPYRLTAAGGRLYFLTGLDPETLWRYDPAGGELISLELTDGSLFGQRRLAAFGGALFLGGPAALLTSDATAGGTSVVRLLDGPPTSLAAAGDGLFFLLPDLSLWRSDGTGGGTGTTGAFAAAPLDIAAAGAVVLFAGLDGLGTEPWRVANGTAARLADLRAGEEGSDPQEFTSYRGNVYFAADDGRSGRELWRSDGTEGGTRLVADLVP